MRIFIFAALFFFAVTPAASAATFGECTTSGQITQCAAQFPNTTYSECISAGVYMRTCFTYFANKGECTVPSAEKDSAGVCLTSLRGVNSFCAAEPQGYGPSSTQCTNAQSAYNQQTAASAQTGKADGLSCSSNSVCASGYCESFICKAAPTTERPNGLSCTSNAVCASGYCESFICKAAPTGGGIQSGPAIPGNQIQTGPAIPANTGTNVTLINPLQGGGNLESFLVNILKFVVRIGTIVVILMLVYVGYLFVAARGEPGKITEARQALLWTIVGALILIGAEVIARGIMATVNAISVGQ